MSHQYLGHPYLSRCLKPLLRSGGLIMGASIVAMSFGVLPALAEKLSDWRYDSQTRSLTLTLPSDITPTLSVVSDSQLLIEIPDTQVGDAIGQTVFDGVVESVVVEQANPDTVWMVVDFAPGTVLSNTQNATQVAVADPNSEVRQWQVRPALLASQVVESSVAAVESDAAQADSDSPAAALRTDRSTAAISSSSAIAQVSDFPDLPVLEPAMSESGPVMVPPINARSAPTLAAPTPPPIASRPPAQVIPVIVPPIAEDSTTEDIIEPPFIGQIDDQIEIEVVDAPITEPTVVSVAPEVPDVAAPEIEIPEIEIPEIEISSVSEPVTTSRWPEPIPFGQPLP